MRIVPKMAQLSYKAVKGKAKVNANVKVKLCAKEKKQQMENLV